MLQPSRGISRSVEYYDIIEACPICEGANKLHKNKFQLKREATLRQLIDAGYACYLELGFAATRIDDIVAKAGYTRGAFYFHFKTKEDVFFHILERRSQLRNGWIEIPRTCRREDTTLEQLVIKCLQELDSRLKDGRKWFMVITDFYMQNKTNPEVCAKLARYYQEWMAELARFVDILKVGGWVSHSTDSHQTAAQIWALTEGYSATSVLFGEYDSNTLLRGIVKLLS